MSIVRATDDPTRPQPQIKMNISRRMLVLTGVSAVVVGRAKTEPAADAGRPNSGAIRPTEDKGRRWFAAAQSGGAGSGEH
jgi:hypothetical protein